MHKLINKMKWVTVLDAAKELSGSLENVDVTEADILRLSLDGHLKLSVNFVNPVKARRGRFIGFENSAWCELTPEMTAKLSNTHPEYKKEQKIHTETSNFPPGQKITPLGTLGLNDEVSITLDEAVIELHDVYDLLMIGNERKDIENKYQHLNGGPLVTVRGVEGIFVQKGSEIFQLQEHRNNDDTQPGSAAQLQKLKERISNQNIDDVKAKEIIDKFNLDRMDFASKLFSEEEYLCYFPARSLPKDGVLVVRTDELQELIKSALYTTTYKEVDPPKMSKPVGHLNHDLEFQQRANAIAAGLFSSSGRSPTRIKVAEILAKELGETNVTVERRLRKEWK